MKDKISERHARALLNIDDSEKQKEMLKKVMSEKMTVRKLEAEIKQLNGEEESQMETTNKPVINIPTLREVPSAESFIPENPILPNFNGENTDLNTPILSNIGNINKNEEPELLVDTQQEERDKPKFINFGEINDDTDNDESADKGLIFNVPKENTAVNIDEIKSNAMDIFTPQVKNSGNADLDSLLQLNNMRPIPTPDKDDNEFKFFSPAEEAIKESEAPTQERIEDYFKAPELVSVDLPSQVQVNDINSVNLTNPSQVINIDGPKNDNSISKAVDKIRNVVEEIEKLGFKVEKDEMALENSYQVIIKIEKETK